MKISQIQCVNSIVIPVSGQLNGLPKHNNHTSHKDKRK